MSPSPDAPDGAPERELAAAEGHIHYSSASQLRRPRQFLTTSARSFRASVPLARRLFVRDVRARYRLSVLGFAWIALPAVAQTGVWLFLNASGIIDSGDTEIPLPVFVLVGTLLWQGFVDSLAAPGSQLAQSGNLLVRVSFPAESLLLAGIADVSVNAVARLLVAVPLLLWYGVIPGWGILLAPLGLAALIVLGTAIGLAIAPFGLLYQDLSRTLVLATGFWLLITPVAYTVPTSGPGRILAVANPVSPLLSATRNWLTGGPVAPTLGFWVTTLLALVLLAVGWVVFRLAIPHLVDRLGT